MRPPSQYPQEIAQEAETEGEPDPRLGAMMICTRMAGRAVIRVIGRCNDAKENENLGLPVKWVYLEWQGLYGTQVYILNYATYHRTALTTIHKTDASNLSDCQLMQVPDAVYHLMRHTELKTCDLSDNVITKIPPKFAAKFNLITDLNLSHNQVSKLPDECVSLGALERLDISHNTFIELPNYIFKIPKLRHLNASNNSIVDLDVDCLKDAPSLESIDLRNNPLAPRIFEQLSRISNLRISLSPREKEDWEDLTI